MVRRSLRAALVAVTAAVVSQVPLAAPAQAIGYCGGGEISFSGSTAGVLDGTNLGNTDDWWRTAVSGTTTIRLQTQSPWTYLSVYTSGCASQLCYANNYGYNHSCTITHTGYVSIRAGLHWPEGSTTPYTLEAPAGECAALPGSPCVVVDNGPVVQTVSVVGPRATVDATHHAVGTLDIYRFDLPTGGSVTLPCVVLVVNDTTSDGCAAAGGEWVSRIARLVDQSVDQPGLAVDVLLQKVKVCAADYTVMVSGIGVQDFPAYSVC